MNYILADDFGKSENWKNLLPLTYTKPIAALRIGIDLIVDKWEDFLNEKCSFHTQNYLQTKFPLKLTNSNTYILSNFIPNEKLVNQIQKLKPNEKLINNGSLLAFCFEGYEIPSDLEKFKVVEIDTECIQLKNIWDIFLKNKQILDRDFERITKNKTSQKLSETNTLIGPIDNIFIEEGAYIEASILNVQEGKIYIGKNAKVLEGSMLRNSVAICENSVIKMGAKVYGATTLGNYSKVGGEISNVVFQAYSNKGHDGYLGNAVIGEWCNLGADTNASNLKNNYQSIKVWNYLNESYTNSNQQFCGLIMGDHSKCGINTMFNTGTVVGVSANIYGAGFPKGFIPSYTWGGVEKNYTYKFNKAIETAKLVMKRRNIELNDIYKSILEHIFEVTSKFRSK